ncbi:hypothetical protein A2V94_07025 [Candidatus Atribacteria bacterium RBG_16_35_8]|nr:MAG: hypothetical protein A2V94_07025 [Candidatus Atribacteria bacterium RBG_16_35_8]
MGIQEEIIQVINNWEALSAVAALIAILQLIMKILKLPRINGIFILYGKKWIKPYITVGLGAILGALSTYTTSANIYQSIVSGIFIALGSIGWNELLNKTQKNKREE